MSPSRVFEDQPVMMERGLLVHRVWGSNGDHAILHCGRNAKVSRLKLVADQTPPQVSQCRECWRDLPDAAA